MLKLFFNKESKLVYAMEILGLFLLIILVAFKWPSAQSTTVKIAFYILIAEYLIMKTFAILRWYDDDGVNTIMFPKSLTKKREVELQEEKYPGIELQLKKAMVLAAYMISIFPALLLLGLPGEILWIPDILLALMGHVGIILVFFHMKDKEKVPVNFFTHNKHLS